MKTPRKCAALIKAWADGAEIEVLYRGIWQAVENPQWDKCYYRIKPEPKPDVVDCRCVARRDDDGIHLAHIKLIWDGETGELKAAEVIA